MILLEQFRENRRELAGTSGH